MYKKALPSYYRMHSSGLWVPPNGKTIYKQEEKGFVALKCGRRGKAPNWLYPYVSYEGKLYYAHALVVETFADLLPYIEENAPKDMPLETNHINHNVKDYKVSNLERVTRSQNQLHRRESMTYRTIYKESI